jgi:hypothetical protein
MLSSNLHHLSAVMGQGITGFDENTRHRLDSFMQPQKIIQHKIEIEDHVIPDIGI